MTNAYAEARRLAREKAEGTTVFIPLGILQDLLAELDRYRPHQVETVGEIVSDLHKPKGAA